MYIIDSLVVIDFIFLYAATIVSNRALIKGSRQHDEHRDKMPDLHHKYATCKDPIECKHLTHDLTPLQLHLVHFEQDNDLRKTKLAVQETKPSRVQSICPKLKVTVEAEHHMEDAIGGPWKKLDLKLDTGQSTL